MHLLTLLKVLLINIQIPIASFHKYDKILAADLYGDLYMRMICMGMYMRQLPMVKMLYPETEFWTTSMYVET